MICVTKKTSEIANHEGHMPEPHIKLKILLQSLLFRVSKCAPQFLSDILLTQVQKKVPILPMERTIRKRPPGGALTPLPRRDF